MAPGYSLPRSSILFLEGINPLETDDERGHFSGAGQFHERLQSTLARGPWICGVSFLWSLGFIAESSKGFRLHEFTVGPDVLSEIHPRLPGDVSREDAKAAGRDRLREHAKSSSDHAVARQNLRMERHQA